MSWSRFTLKRQKVPSMHIYVMVPFHAKTPTSHTRPECWRLAARLLKMAEGLKSRALSVITRSSKRDHSDVESSPSKSISNSERSNDHGRVAEKDEPSDKRRTEIAGPGT